MKFCRFKGEKSEWSVEGKSTENNEDQWVTFGDINLVVGKNATGKSRTINIIRQLADLLVGNYKISDLNQNYKTSSYSLIFEDNGFRIEYQLDFEDGKVVIETLTENNIRKLERNGNEGKLFYDKANTTIEFQMEDNKLSISRVDDMQHPFLRKLYDWGKNLNHYKFGGELGKNTFMIDTSTILYNLEIDLKDNNNLNATEVLLRARKKFGEDYFDNIIIKDFEKIGYNIHKVNPENHNILSFPSAFIGLCVEENDLETITNQMEMSQGMFRALSLLVLLNYSLLSKIPSCILIDDIGEGLDYERSKSLIDLIIEKVKGTSIQAIMTTNDRFVMNKIPLEYWSVIHRIPKKSIFYNYRNSKEIFDDFKYTGLNNFDFLSTEFYTTGFETQPITQE